MMVNGEGGMMLVRGVSVGLAVLALAGCTSSEEEKEQQNTHHDDTTFSVTTNTSEGGAISPASAIVASGDLAEFSVVAENGHTISTVTGCGGELTGNIYTISSVSENCEVSATFITTDPQTYTVNAFVGVGGDILPSSANLEEGETASFTISTESGYSIRSVTGCGGALSNNLYTTGEVTADCSVVAHFIDDELDTTTFSVTTNASEGGAISPPSAIVASGDLAEFSVVAENGYTISTVTGCGGELTGNIYTISSVSENCEVSATFITTGPQTHTVNAFAGVGGSILPSSANLEEGETASFTISAESGYSISSVTGCGGALSNNTYTTGAVTADCSVVAHFIDDNGDVVEAGSLMHAIEVGKESPIVIDGKEWSFRTAPPPEAERIVREDHPRLLITQDTLPSLRNKLQDPVYNSYMNSITRSADEGSMLENAFLYQITGDASRAAAAKSVLLAYSGNYGEGIIFGYDRMADKLGPILVFDWIMDTLTLAEKNEIFGYVKDNFGYDHRTANPINRDGNGEVGGYPWYFNDVYNRHPELYLPALAFTIHDQEIDNDWANEVIAWAYIEDEARVVGPYGENRGSGFLDALASMSLDSGGLSPTGYYNYIIEVLHAVAFWETATRQPMWSRMPVFEKGPFTCVTRCKNDIVLHSRKSAAFEYATGVYSGDTAALAKHVIDTYDASRYQAVYRAILGDLRVTAKSPEQLDLPLAGYLRGEHTFYSRSSWSSDAVSLQVRSPYLNVARYPGNDGIFALYKGDDAISPVVGISKTAPDSGLYSGMWIYDPENIDPEKNSGNKPLQNKGTYWSNYRSYDAWTTVSQSRYFDGGPESIEVADTYRAISMEYGDRYNTLDVGTAQRVIVHIPDMDRDFIVVYDFIDVATNLKSAWSMRLAAEPTVSDGRFSLAGLMTATVVSPQGHTMEWLGGMNKEFVTPSPEQAWYTNMRGGAVPGYSINSSDVDRYALGNLYIQPAGQKDSSEGPFVPQTEYLVVLEVGELAPVEVERISAREVTFGKWRVAFQHDGTYEVSLK